ncbi:MAG TPA: ABC transporter permease [Pseudolysinimonas sp.]|nr:ABC transporter permease [Pseudolysinimonas sp.]
MAFGAFATPDAVVGEAPRRRSRAALWLLLPGVVYLAATYLAPLVSLVITSLKAPDLVSFDIGRYVYAFQVGNYAHVLGEYWPIILRSFGYSAIATVAALLISYPLAYFIGVSLRRFPLWQALALILVIAPFFMSFLLRTLAWKSLFADEGPIVGFLQSVHLLGDNAHVNGTPFMVIFGLTYNYIPFMALPIYTSLERLDLRYLEAGADLYANPATTFLRVTLPLSLPGVVSGTLLTFIPATGDYVNASPQFLGSTQTTMVGNVISDTYFNLSDYPSSAALSILLMVLILIPVAVYLALTRTEDVL